MNLYFFLEGRRTEPKVYRSWIKFVFPQLVEVQRIEDVQHDNYLLISGLGYPQLLNHVNQILSDIAQHNNVDHFFVCVDAEEEKYEVRLAEIESYIIGKLSNTDCHAIVHNCCIETWFLGNQQMLRRNPHSERLREWKAFYDVGNECPELMGAFSGYRTSAQFHFDYLREMLRERNLRYSKELPSTVQEEGYLKAIVNRYERTGHIQSFGRLLLLWRMIGGRI